MCCGVGGRVGGISIISRLLLLAGNRARSQNDDNPDGDLAATPARSENLPIQQWTVQLSFSSVLLPSQRTKSRCFDWIRLNADGQRGVHDDTGAPITPFVPFTGSHSLAISVP